MSFHDNVASDEQIQRDVLDELKWGCACCSPMDRFLGGQGTGIVPLTGWFDSFAKKWVAERAAAPCPRW